MVKMITPPIKYHGGKHYLAKRIIEMMPKHTHYVEPYAGGLAVLWAKSYEGFSEVVNDLNGELINFWRTLAEPSMFKLLRRAAEGTPFSQEIFREAEHCDSDNPVDRALAFFIRARQSRQGLGKSFATLSRTRTRRGMNEQVSSWLTALEGLPEVHDRLKRVVICNMDAVALIAQQDDKHTFFYCDPPYLAVTRSADKSYRYEMSKSQHLELLNVLANIKGKFVLSGYSSLMYERWADKHGIRCEQIMIDNKASSAKVKEMKTECLWYNYAR